MKDQPAFPADETPQPAPDCPCDLCRQQRAEAAAVAIVTLLEPTKPDGKESPAVPVPSVVTGIFADKATPAN
jgi:hypothetical protein